MPGRLHELKGSGDFQAGPSGVSGKLLYLAIGYESQSEAYDAAQIAALPNINGIPRGSISVVQHAPKYYGVEVEYASGIRPEGVQGAGQAPPENDGSLPGNIDGGLGSRPDSAPRQASELLGSELSFSVGGGTQRIYISKKTLHAVARQPNFLEAAPPAPNFQRLIGVSKSGVEGCEIYAGQCNLTISQRFARLELGYFNKLMKAVATTNKEAFGGFKPGEVLFFGADGGYKHGDENPWSISGKFGMSPNRQNVAIDDNGLLRIPEIKGWNYVWTYNEKTTETIGGVTYEIERPKFAYCEQVYDETDFKILKMDF